MANTTTEILTVDGTVLNTLAKNVSSLTGRLRVPGQRGANPVVPGRHGAIHVRSKTYEPGQIILPMWVRGCDDNGTIPGGSTERREFYKRVDELTALFTRSDDLLDVRHTLPDGSIRQALCEVTEVVDFTTEAVNPCGLFTVVLDVPDVWWRDTGSVTHDTGTGLTLAHTASMTNFAGATAPMEDLTFVFTGPVTNPKVEAYRNSAALAVPNWFMYSGTVAAGQTLTVNSGSWTLSATGFTPTMSALSHTGSPRWLVVHPGPAAAAPQVVFSGSSYSTATKLVITGRRKYWVG